MGQGAGDLLGQTRWGVACGGGGQKIKDGGTTADFHRLGTFLQRFSDVIQLDRKWCISTHTSEDDVGHVVSAGVSAAVVLILVVEELLVPGVLEVQRVLQVQGALGVSRERVLVGAAAAQTAVVQRQTVPLVVHHELKQRTEDTLEDTWCDVVALLNVSSDRRAEEAETWQPSLFTSDHLKFCLGGAAGETVSDDITCYLLGGFACELQVQVGVVQQRVEQGVLKHETVTTSGGQTGSSPGSK